MRQKTIENIQSILIALVMLLVLANLVRSGLELLRPHSTYDPEVSSNMLDR